MKTFTLYIVLVALLGFATLSSAEIIQWEKCGDESNCTVHEVNVSPCREAAQNRPCRIRRGRTASIRFDFTPNFSSDTLTTRAYWSNELLDLPFIGMDTNACLYTTCPATAGTRQTYNYTIPIDKNFDARIYDVKWKIESGNVKEEEKEECCFLFQIRLSR